MVNAKVNACGITLLPIGPWRAWLESRIEEEARDHPWVQSHPFNHGVAELAPRERVAAALGVRPETLRKWLKGGRKWVYASVVDAACCMAGTHMAEIYPEWYAEAA